MARSRRAGPFSFQRRLPSRGGGKHLGTPRSELWREPPGWAFPLSGPTARPRAKPCSPFFRGGGERLGTPRPGLWREAAGLGLSPFGPPARPRAARAWRPLFPGRRKAFGNAALRTMARSRRAGPFPFRGRLPGQGRRFAPFFPERRKASRNAAPRTMARSRRAGPFPFQGRLPGQGRRFAAPFSEASESIWERRAPNYGAKPPGWAFPLPGPTARPRAALCGPFFRGIGKHLGTPRSELWREAAGQGLSPSNAACRRGAAESIWERRAPNYGASRRAGLFPFRAACPAKGGALRPLFPGRRKYLRTPRPAE